MASYVRTSSISSYYSPGQKNPLSMSPRTDLNPDSPYHYTPTESITITFLVLFSISTLIHIAQVFRYRTWWLLPTAVLCGAMEIAGWAARTWSSISPTLSTPFTIQITATILAPTPLVAVNFVVLGKLIGEIGPEYSWLTPKWYSIIFCTCDVFSLVIQGAGGGIASTANTDKGSALGGNIMLAGIIFQLVMLIIYIGCAINFFTRYLRNTPLKRTSSATGSWNELEQHGQLESPWSGNSSADLNKFRCMTKNQKIMAVALCFSTLFLFIRAIYRTIELSDGWNGKVISTQVYFNVLDGAMVVLAIYSVNVAHPGRLLRPKAL